MLTINGYNLHYLKIIYNLISVVYIVNILFPLLVFLDGDKRGVIRSLNKVYNIRETQYLIQRFQ